MANPWKNFYALIKGGRKSIALVISTNSDTKRVLVQEAGSSTQVYVESNGSDYADGSYVYIEGGIITGQAPELRSVVTELLS